MPGWGRAWGQATPCLGASAHGSSGEISEETLNPGSTTRLCTAGGGQGVAGCQGGAGHGDRSHPAWGPVHMEVLERSLKKLSAQAQQHGCVQQVGDRAWLGEGVGQATPFQRRGEGWGHGMVIGWTLCNPWHQNDKIWLSARVIQGIGAHPA